MFAAIIRLTGGQLLVAAAALYIDANLTSTLQHTPHEILESLAIVLVVVVVARRLVKQGMQVVELSIARRFHRRDERGHGFA